MLLFGGIDDPMFPSRMPRGSPEFSGISSPAIRRRALHISTPLRGYKGMNPKCRFRSRSMAATIFAERIPRDINKQDVFS
jgi:hypothetical protein